jgi:CheY-like chemotaxis protein
MARGFAEQSGGGLTLESAPGRGTTVSLWLPRAAVPAGGADAAARAAPAAGPRLAVLLVDDEPGVRAVLAAALEERGHAVLEAADAAAALARLDAGEAVEALVTDLSMPGGADGLALVREARRRRPGLPAILITGHVGDATPEALAEAAGSGPFAVLRKPASAETVEAQLALLAEGARG